MKAIKHLLAAVLIASCSISFADSWVYRSSKDAMTGGENMSAMVESKTEAKLSFPYNDGRNRVLMSVIRLARYSGEVVLVLIERGQLTCGYRQCQVFVRFDDEPAERWDAEKTTNSHKSLFIKNSATFIEKLKNSNTVLVELNFYQDSTQIFEFDTSNLKW